MDKTCEAEGCENAATMPVCDDHVDWGPGTCDAAGCDNDVKHGVCNDHFSNLLCSSCEDPVSPHQLYCADCASYGECEKCDNEAEHLLCGHHMNEALEEHGSAYALLGEVAQLLGEVAQLLEGLTSQDLIALGLETRLDWPGIVERIRRETGRAMT